MSSAGYFWSEEEIEFLSRVTRAIGDVQPSLVSRGEAVKLIAEVTKSFPTVTSFQEANRRALEFLTLEYPLENDGQPDAALSAQDQDSEIHSPASRRVVSEERQFAFITAKQFGEMTPESPDWLVPGQVAVGAITEIDGKIKAAGKTTYVTHLCRSVLDGLPFLGLPTRQTKIVYLTEQPGTSFREALRRAGLLEREDLLILKWSETLGSPWPETCARAVSKAKEFGAELLIVDTLGQFAGLKGDAENNAGDALDAVKPLQRAAADGLGVALTRHDRKAGGEVGDSARGSSAFGGAVDIVMSIRRPEGKHSPSVRVIQFLSRFDESPQSLAIELSETGYVALGPEGVLAEERAKAMLLERMPASEAEAKPLAEILEACEDPKPGKTVFAEVAKKLTQGDDPLLRRTAKGHKNDPFKYWRPSVDQIHSSATSTQIADERISTSQTPIPTFSKPVTSGRQEAELCKGTKANTEDSGRKELF